MEQKYCVNVFKFTHKLLLGRLQFEMEQKYNVDVFKFIHKLLYADVEVQKCHLFII